MSEGTGLELLAGQRQKRETSRAVQACNDYLRLGPGRSLRVVWESYTQHDSILPPTLNFQTLKDWSARYGWVARAEAYDAECERVKNERRKEVMESGLALDYERVKTLKRIAALLEGEIEKRAESTEGPDGQPVEGERYRVWLPDVKQIGSGDDAERVDIERYNSPIFGDLRGVLDDLAKETGGRVTRQDITSGGKKLFDVDSWMKQRQARRDAVESMDDETQDSES